jgi:hypothetical protein
MPDDTTPKGPLGAGPAQELVSFSRTLDADYPPDHPMVVQAVEAARNDVEEALKDRRRQLAGERKVRVGNVRAVVGDPRWEGVRNEDGALVSRVTVQGHLEVAGEHGASEADDE